MSILSSDSKSTIKITLGKKFHVSTTLLKFSWCNLAGPYLWLKFRTDAQKRAKTQIQAHGYLYERFENKKLCIFPKFATFSKFWSPLCTTISFFFFFFFPSSFSFTKNQLNKILGLQWQILRNAFQPLNWFTQTAGILHDDCHVGQTLICLVKFNIVQNQQRRNCLSEVAKIGMWTHF